MFCTQHNTDIGKMIESFTCTPVQGMTAIPVIFLVKEFYDFIICVKRHRLILAGYQFNLRLILTVRLNPDAEMLDDITAHRRRAAPCFAKGESIGYNA